MKQSLLFIIQLLSSHQAETLQKSYWFNPYKEYVQTTFEIYVWKAVKNTLVSITWKKKGMQHLQETVIPYYARELLKPVAVI